MRKLLLSASLAFVSVPAMAAAPEPTGPANVPAEIAIAGPVVMVTDLEKSLKFYVDGLGLRVANRLPGPPGPGAILLGTGPSQTPFLLIRQGAADPARSPAIAHGNALSRVMLVVPDSAVVAARLTAAGYPHEPVNARHIVFVKDPDGYAFEIIQRDSRP